MIKRQRILEAWNNFSAAVLPKDCSNVQRVESRRCFYAGAKSFYRIVMRDLEAVTMETQDDMEMMAGLHNELEEFAKGVREGRY